MKNFKCTPDYQIINNTIMASLLLLIMYAASLHYDHQCWFLIIAETFFFVFYFTNFLLRPIRLQVTDHSLNIWLLCFRKKIPYNHILEIKDTTIVTGIKNFNCWSAWKYTCPIRKDEKLFSFCNNKKNSFLVHTDKCYYLLSCNHSKVLIEWINKQKGIRL